MCCVAAVIAAAAGLAAFASAQITSNPPPAANNPLTAECGLKVMLVLDASASIVSPGSGLANQTAVVRGAANAFVGALAGTGSELATASFWNRGYAGIGYQEVTTASANNVFTPWINGTSGAGTNPFNPTSSNTATNWEDAFRQVLRTGAPNLVLFVTDGDPNTYNSGPGTPPSNSSVTTSTTAAGVQTALNRAAAAANDVKADPIKPRIFAIGVGPAVTNTDSRERLTTVSGPTRFPATAGQLSTNTFRDADFSTVDFSQLRDELTGIVSALCGSRLLITKQVPDHTGALTDASGWKFTTTLEPAGGHTWLVPSQATNGTATGPSASLTTGADGIADFQWRLHSADHTVNVHTIKETEKSGVHFVSATCQNEGPDGPIGQPEVDTLGIPGATLGREDFRKCTVLNRPSMANLTVVKSLEPEGDLGLFNLHIGGVADALNVGDVQGTGPHSLPLGTYTVSETAGTGTSLADYDTSISCVDLANNYHDVVPTHMGTSVSVPLTSDGQDVVCTIRNVSTKFGQITVIKHLIPENDSGRFNLLVGGTVEAPAVGDGGHTPPIRLPFGTHEVTETGANGTNLAHYNISTTCIDEHTGDTVAHNTHGPSVSVDLSRASDSIECTIENERPGVKVARLEVIKHLVPNGDAGRFDLLIGSAAFALGVGHNGSTGPLEFELGTHSVTEHEAGRTALADFLISTTCVDKAHGGHTVAHNAHGPSVSVDLTNESEDIVCTITNRRTAPPGGGGSAATGPDLAVIKTMPAHARVGELVPITITVHNLGHGVAQGVQLHETPPAGMRIVHVADHGTIQHGIAVWHLGDLAPGESRTVHATARVLHAGLHVDTAVATALNADPALSDAALRARAAARRPRPPSPPPPLVTG